MLMNIEKGKRREGKEKRQKGERIGRVSEVIYEVLHRVMVINKKPNHSSYK
jgi:hypothetical protein